MTTKGPEAFRTISEAADEVGVPAHVLRFWETKFSFIRPLRRPGGRRFYRPADIATLIELRVRLHDQHQSIKSLQGLKRLAPAAKPDALSASAAANTSDALLQALRRAVAAKTRLDALLSPAPV